MIFIKFDARGVVNYQHNLPFDPKDGLGKTQEELEKEGLLVDTIPEPEQIPGKSANLYCNPATKELYYEYEDIPEAPEQAQAERINQLEPALLEMSTISALQEQKANENEQAILELTMLMAGGVG